MKVENDTNLGGINQGGFGCICQRNPIKGLRKALVVLLTEYSAVEPGSGFH